MCSLSLRVLLQRQSVFEDHLSQVLPCILGGLADEAEGVRDAALAAGKRRWLVLVVEVGVAVRVGMGVGVGLLVGWG